MLSLDELGVALLDELELGLLESLEPLVEPAPAAPLPLVDEDELDGVEDEPPLALSFFWMSTEVDEELEPDGVLVLGAAVVPLADEDEELGVLGELVAPEPDGLVVVDELEAPEGARLSPRSHPASTAAPNAMETARANVENFMWPPWLGYRHKSARIGPALAPRSSRQTACRRPWATAA